MNNNRKIYKSYNHIITQLYKQELLPFIKNNLNNKISKSEYNQIKDSHIYKIDNDFLFGYKKEKYIQSVNNEKKTINYNIVWTIDNKNKNNKNIYPRTKIKILKQMITILLNKEPIISVVDINDKKALKFNSLIFNYKLKNVYIKTNKGNNQLSIVYTNDINLYDLFLFIKDKQVKENKDTINNNKE